MPKPSDLIANASTADTAVVTTAETVAVASGRAKATRPSYTCIVLGFAQLTTGAGTTAVTPRIRRGSGATGTEIGDAVAEEIKAVAGSDEFFVAVRTDELANVLEPEYALTLQQAGATGNGTILQAGIIVFVL